MGTHYEGPENERHALSAYITLMRASETVTAAGSDTMAETGLTTSQFGVLETLLHLGPLCQRELGNKLLKSSGNITVVVDNLERRGLVRRERSTSDRRMVTVRLTDEGRALIESAFPGHAARIARAMGVLDRSELDDLRRLCRKLGRGQARTGQRRSRGTRTSRRTRRATESN